MVRMTMEQVRERLEPYHARIRQVVLDGYGEWLAVDQFRIDSGFGTTLYSRTVANYVFDAIARNCEATFGDDRSIRIRHEPQTVKFIFGQTVIGRFKKGDDDHLGQNIPTQAVMDYLDPQHTLPGFPPAAKVEFMWKANELGTAIEEVTVAARDRKELLWSYKIDDSQDGLAAGITTLPFGPAPDESTPLVVVRPRKTKRESE